MFARVASGMLSPEAALKAADKKVQGIFKKWRARGMV
jgi:hypothetical protein